MLKILDATQRPVRISSVIAASAVIAGVFVSIVFYDLTVYFFGIPVPRETVFLVALGIILVRVVVLLAESRSGDEHFMVWLALTLLGYQAINLFIAILTVGEPTRALYFTAPIIGVFLVIECRRAFKVVLIAILCASVAAELYETITNEYLFFSEDRLVSGVFYEEFMGEYGVFRAKGFFAGPLTAAYVSLGIALVFRRNVAVLALCLIGAAAASGRGAMLWIVVLLVSALVREFGTARSFGHRLLIWVIVLGTVYAGGSVVFDEAAFERLQNIFSPSEGSNSARLEYWEAAWNLFLSQGSYFGAVFGSPNLFHQEFESSAENDYLQILIDYGVVGFGLFFSGLIWTVTRLKTSFADRLFVLAVVGLMVFIAPPLSAMTTSILFWFFLFGELASTRELSTVDHRFVRHEGARA